MNIKKGTSINKKILIYLIFFSVFILLLLWETQLILSNFLYKRYQVKDMNNIAKEIKDYDGNDLGKYLLNVVYNNNVCIEYVDSNGGSILYNDDSTGCLLGKNNIDIKRYKADIYKKGEESIAIELINPDYKSYALLYGIKVDSGYVFLFTMLSNINKNYNAVKTQLIYITFLVIFLAIIISLFLSKKLSEPIVKITEKSKKLARGDYDVNFDKSGIKEIDELADTLNYLKTEVSKTDEYRRDLMANVSHDLKTPLTMIKAYAEMVRDISYADKEKRDANLNVIIEESDRLNGLVNDILVLSKIQANAEEMNKEEFDLCLEIKQVINRYDILKELEGYKIVLDLPENAFVKADKAKINQVVYNLINNALNYTGKDKTVRIKVSESKKDYLVEVIDSGKGISKEDLKYIWDKYYKNEKNHKRNVVGTGLGLSIVKNILEKHNFKYGVLSEKDKGSTFYFRIKRVKK